MKTNLNGSRCRLAVLVAVVSVSVVGASWSVAQADTYVGASACTTCHTQEHTDWAATEHAHALASLEAIGAGTVASCLPCHTTGYGQGGFVSRAATPGLADVQCEMCHGPASAHVADPFNVKPPKSLAAEICGACHTTHQHPTFEEWQSTAHATALPSLVGSGHAQDFCLQCHSTDYRLAPAGEKPTVQTAQLSITCVDCHAPHGSSHDGQLRQDVDTLCGSCHTMSGAAPPSSPHHPNLEMFDGVGGVMLDGQPQVGPNASHTTMLAEKCTSCHYYTLTRASPTPLMPNITGHTFKADVRGCTACHTTTQAQTLIANTQTYVGGRAAGLAKYFTPGDPSYIDPAGLTEPSLQSGFYNARFDWQFVSTESSVGVHNAVYANALLDVAQSFVDLVVPPTVRSDFDRDADVDLADFAVFLSCFNGPARFPAQSACIDADFDGDLDVDLADFGVFLACFNGPARPPAAGCE